MSPHTWYLEQKLNSPQKHYMHKIYYHATETMLDVIKVHLTKYLVGKGIMLFCQFHKVAWKPIHRCHHVILYLHVFPTYNST